MQREKIVDRFMSNVWLVSNIFWKYSDAVVYNTRKEKAKNLLSEVYWYKDIHMLFPSEVDENKTINLVKVLNQYYEQWNAEPVTADKSRS